MLQISTTIVKFDIPKHKVADLGRQYGLHFGKGKLFIAKNKMEIVVDPEHHDMCTVFMAKWLFNKAGLPEYVDPIDAGIHDHIVTEDELKHLTQIRKSY